MEYVDIVSDSDAEDAAAPALLVPRPRSAKINLKALTRKLRQKDSTNTSLASRVLVIKVPGPSTVLISVRVYQLYSEIYHRTNTGIMVQNTNRNGERRPKRWFGMHLQALHADW